MFRAPPLFGDFTELTGDDGSLCCKLDVVEPIPLLPDSSCDMDVRERLAGSGASSSEVVTAEADAVEAAADAVDRRCLLLNGVRL